MIRIQYLVLLATLTFASPTALADETPPVSSMFSEAQKQTLHRQTQSLLQKYSELPISPKSPDYSLFEVTGKAAHANAEFMDVLIDLTAIQEVRPDTTEKLSPTRLSPAGRELLIIGEGVKPLIQARLDRGGLTQRQIAVLKDIIYFMDLKASRLTDSAEPPRPSGQQEESTKTSSAVAPMAPPPAAQAPPAKKTPEAKPTTSTPSKQPTSSLRWSIAAVVIVGALALLWILLKKRK